MLSKKEIVLTIYMKEILETHPVTNLKSILRNIKGDIGAYSKMKKAELIDKIMELKKKGFPVPKVEKYVKPKDPKKINISKSGTPSVLKPATTIYQNRSKLLKSYETGDKEMTEKSFKIIKKRIEDAFELEEITKNQKNLLLGRLKKLEPKKPAPKEPVTKKPEPKKVVDRTKIGKMILKDYTKKAINDTVSKIKTIEEFENYVKKSYKILDNFDSRKGASNLNPKTEKRVRILVNLFNTHAKRALQDNPNSSLLWENELPNDESAPFNLLLIDPKTKLPYGFKDYDFNDWQANQYVSGGISIQNDLDLFLEDPVLWFSYATPKQIKEMKKSEHYRSWFKTLKSNKEDYNKVIKAHTWVKKLI
jgi:hypothetical protein